MHRYYIKIDSDTRMLGQISLDTILLFLLYGACTMAVQTLTTQGEIVEEEDNNGNII